MRASPRPVGRVTFNPPEWATLGGDPFLPLVGGTSSLAPPPLFQPIQARVILSAALATIHDGTEVDAERATAAVAEGRRMERIPFRRIATLRRGAQVLVDRSPAMDPLRHDIEHVLSELRRILGPGRLQILDFLHCPGPSSAPLRGVWADGRDRQLWKPPGRGVPVLVISDVTMAPPIGGRESATASEWLAFFTELHAAQCHGVALVPFSPGRWPPLLSRAATFLHWSERTTARQILQALRESRARLRGRR